MYTIVWATDGSSGAEDALPAARRLAEMSGGRIVAVHCNQRFDALESDVVKLIDQQVDALRAAGIDTELIVRQSRQDSAETVAAVAREVHADVVVCGTRGRSPAASALLGSFTQRLLHVAPCPVFSVPPTAVAAVRA